MPVKLSRSREGPALALALALALVFANEVGLGWNEYAELDDIDIAAGVRMG